MGGLDLLANLVKVAIVFGLLMVTLRVLARTQGARSGGRNRPASRTAVVEVLDQSRLGRTASVVAIRVGDRAFLLGVTEERVDNLAELTGDIDLAEHDDDVERHSVLDHAVDLLRSGTFRR